jgi:pimeloyl-ACP methyl ester carboxylesterase
VSSSPDLLIDAALGRHPLRTVEAGGRRFSYRDSGAGQPVVLLHGIGSSSASWIPLFDALPGFRLIGWDAPGYGESDALPAARPRASDYGEALRVFLGALGLEAVPIVGHSLGALMAGAFAVAQPARTTRLVLLDPAGGYASASPEAREKVRTGRLEMLANLGPARMAVERGAQLLSSRPDALALAWVQYSMSRVHPAGYAQAVHMLADSDLAADAARCRGPVLVACGSEDRVTPEAGCRAIAAAFPAHAGARYHTVPGAGHASYVEAPRAVADLLDGFLRAPAP